MLLVSNKKSLIGILAFCLITSLSFVPFYAEVTCATSLSGYDAEQALKKRKEEVAASKNAKKNNTSKDILVVENEFEEEEFEDTSNTNKKPVGHQLYDTEHHNNLYDKSNVITAGGGGNMGEGGGAAKSEGGTAGKSISFSDTGTGKQEVIKKSISNTDGKDLISETMGFAKDDGKFYRENEGDHAGAKIFEFDRNGSFGFDDDHIAVSNIKGFMSFFLFAAFGLGGLSFFMATRDVRSKNNYF